MASPGLSYVAEPGTPSTVSALLEARAAATPDAPFVTFDGTTLTYAEIVARADRTAAGLAERGVVPGTKVAVLLPNSLEILETWFACSLIGAVLVPVNTGLLGDGLRYILEHSEAELLVVDHSLLETLERAYPIADGLSRRFVRGDSGGAPSSYEPYAALTAAGDHGPRATLAPDTLASILYTSGTTGLPKGVMNCHNSYVTAALEFTRNYVRMREDDVLYTSLPLFHVNAQSLTTLGSIVSGRPMVLAPRFSASRFFDDLAAHGATVFNYIGAMLTMLYKQPERAGDADNKVRLTVGGAAPAELWRDFERRFGLEVLEIYGLTETATFCCGSPPDAIRPGRIGKPVSWAEVKVVDENDAELPPDEPGEIVVRPKRDNILFQGYYKRDDATAEAMQGGWFHTGDRGSRDADGYLAFIDRLKDSIRRRGENISSYEVERVVNAHPDVAESAAYGVPSDLGEDEVMVTVIAAEGFDPGALVAFCEERMARFMVPRYVRVAPELPKTATQRVQKFELRKLGIEGAWDRLDAAEEIKR
ncbi:MAG TPA: ATP-dependent acyl-CoA ligase [Solirubrobacterales bacterium]